MILPAKDASTDWFDVILSILLQIRRRMNLDPGMKIVGLVSSCCCAVEVVLEEDVKKEEMFIVG